MAADNAIIIGLIAANFAPKNRKQIIMYGVFAAFIFRVIFALSATYLFEFAIIKVAGGILLVWIVNDLRQDLFGGVIMEANLPSRRFFPLFFGQQVASQYIYLSCIVYHLWTAFFINYRELFSLNFLGL